MAKIDVTFGKALDDGGFRKVEVYVATQAIGTLHRDPGMDGWAGSAGVEKVFGEVNGTLCEVKAEINRRATEQYAIKCSRCADLYSSEWKGGDTPRQVCGECKTRARVEADSAMTRLQRQIADAVRDASAAKTTSLIAIAARNRLWLKVAAKGDPSTDDDRQREYDAENAIQDVMRAEADAWRTVGDLVHEMEQVGR